MRSVMDFITEQEAAVVNAMGEPQVRQMVGLTFAYGRRQKAHDTADTGAVIAVVMWLFFAVGSVFLLPPYVRISARADTAVSSANLYGLIVCIGSLGFFLESIFTKAHQAKGNMLLPTVAQIAGAICVGRRSPS